MEELNGTQRKLMAGIAALLDAYEEGTGDTEHVGLSMSFLSATEPRPSYVWDGGELRKEKTELERGADAVKSLVRRYLNYTYPSEDGLIQLCTNNGMIDFLDAYLTDPSRWPVGGRPSLGDVMKASKGIANPAVVQRLLSSFESEFILGAGRPL